MRVPDAGEAFGLGFHHSSDLKGMEAIKSAIFCLRCRLR
jgi:hypothetical protein